MSKQYAMAKTSVKFQNDWLKTVGGVVLTSQLLTNGQVTAHLYWHCTCVLTQVRQKQTKNKKKTRKIPNGIKDGFFKKINQKVNLG